MPPSLLVLSSLLVSIHALPTKRELSSANNFLYFAGYSDDALSDKTFGYDGSTWSEVAGTLNTKRWDACGVVLGSSVYLVGGWTSAGVTNTVEKYDGTAWTLMSSTLITARRVGPNGCIVWNGKIWAVGGQSASISNEATVEIYDPAADAWSAGPSLPVGRRGVGLAVHDGRLIVVGGSDGSAMTSVISIGASETSWTTEASLNSARFYHSVTSFNGKVYAAGGYGGGATVESFDGTSWSSEPSMSAERDRFAFVTAMEGGTCHLYAFGRRSSDRSVERLGADSTSWEAHSQTAGFLWAFSSVALGTSACPSSAGAAPSLPAAQANGDPHLMLGHGGKADFRGTDKGLYNFLSAKNLSLNVMTEFADFNLHDQDHPRHKLVHGSFLTQAHMVAMTEGGHMVHASYWAGKIGSLNIGWMNATIDNQPAFSLGPHMTKVIDDVEVHMDYSSLHLTTSEWEVTVTPQAVERPVAGPVRRIDVQMKPRVAESKLSVPPHGVIGQSWDGDNKAVFGREDQFPTRGEYTTSAMAEGAIEGVPSDYLMASRYATEFKYSRFGLEHASPRDVSKLTGHVEAATPLAGGAGIMEMEE